MIASALATLALACAGCSEPPPRIPLRDAGADPDGGPTIRVDSGRPILPGRRDGGPLLPPADHEIVLPYFGPSVEEPLEVAGEVGTLDVFFSIDTTGSFGGEIDNLQAQLETHIVPELSDRVDDVAFGVGRFEDFPAMPFGDPGDRPFALGTAVTTDTARVASAVALLDQPLGSGGDIPESGAEALYQIATGEGYRSLIPRWSASDAESGGGTLGGVGFRSDALRVVVHVTDAPAHTPDDYGAAFPDTRSLAESIEALSTLGVRVLGVSSGDAARPHLEELAIGTSAVVDPTDGECLTGVNGAARAPREGRCPLVFDVRADGSGLAEAIVDAIADLLSTVRYGEVWGESDDALGFVRAIEAVSAEPVSGITPPTRADRRPEDGVDDTFVDVGPGTLLAFRAHLRNETIPPADYDQIFNLTLRIVGDGVTLLSRRIRVTVPRGRLDAGVLDAGVRDAGPPATDGGLDGSPDAG